jgi:structural maintenance of chromosome 1
LKRLFPGVYGRIIDLAKPKNPRYNLAMTVALGGQVDSIVVQDEKTGMECIQYMKEQRVGTATFLPLDTIKTKPFDEGLRNLGKRMHFVWPSTYWLGVSPIIDVIQFDPIYQRAFEYVCGSTLVVETLDQARKYAFGGKDRHRVVALDGSLILKSGLMTGGLGSSSRLEKKASRWVSFTTFHD